MYYLDSNVFILPVLYEDESSTRALQILQHIMDGLVEGATSVLTLDEVTWVLSRKTGREIALRQTRRIMDFPYLRILDVRKNDIKSALGLMQKHSMLAPRDAIHVAVALNNGYSMIVSDDDDFSNIEEIQHIPLTIREGP